MKHTLYILLFFYIWAIKANSTSTIDSLHLAAKSHTGQERLKTLLQILSTNRFDNSPHDLNAFIDEAMKQSNHLYLATAYAYKSESFRFDENLDSMKIYAEKGLEELSKVNKQNKSSKENKDLHCSTVFHCNELLVKSYFRQNKVYHAIHAVEQMLEGNREDQNVTIEADAYYLLSLIRLMYMENYELGVSDLEKCIKLNSENLERKIDSYLLMHAAFLGSKQYDKLLVITDTLENYIEKEYLIDEFDIKTVYYHTAYAYIKLGSLSKAKDYLDKIDERNFEDPDIVSQRVLNAEYFILAKDYNRALEEINFALANNQTHPLQNIVAQKEVKATVLRHLGRNAEAYDLLEEISEENYIIWRDQAMEQVSELEILHRVDKLKNDLILKDSELHAFRLHLGGSIVVTLLVIVVAIVVWRGNKKLRERNRDLYKRHKKLEELTQELEDRQSDKRVINDDLDSDDIIINKLDALMRESKSYLKSEVTRDDLAIEIGTNRQYLVAAIKEKRSQTFNEYIYLWRLKYAYNLLIHNKDIPISEIFLESGFSSQSVFNREFKKSYGMTPSELRTAAEEVQKSS